MQNVEALIENHVLADAELATGLHDWGEDLSFLTGLRIFIDAVEEMHPSAILRDTVRQRIQRILTTRLHLIDDARQHLEIQITRTGLP